MPGRFTERELDAFSIDPRKPGGWCVCPFCGGLVVDAHRRDNGNRTIAHETLPDPTRPGARLSGCEAYRRVDLLDFLRLLKSQGVEWKKLVG